ncbi:MAG: thiamine pyrophosphate-binding protein [Candidatus Omnitrophica bacterium]|nr:thiamine pyrophosphate-binding protein [Candidatus Omnitrophota bacterium]
MALLRTGSVCLEALKSRGFNFFTGVADSTISSLIEELYQDPAGYVAAVREDLAVGMAAGAYLAGRWPCVLMQNSGLGYCLNALTSLNLIYRIPSLLIVGYRGYQGNDAPEHLVMGAHCTALLEEVGIPVQVPEPDQLVSAIGWADKVLRDRRIPAAVFIKPGVMEK